MSRQTERERWPLWIHAVHGFSDPRVGFWWMDFFLPHPAMHSLSSKQHLTTHISPKKKQKTKKREEKKNNYILQISPPYASTYAPPYAHGARAPSSHRPSAPVRTIPAAQRAPRGHSAWLRNRLLRTPIGGRGGVAGPTRRSPWPVGGGPVGAFGGLALRHLCHGGRERACGGRRRGPRELQCVFGTTLVGAVAKTHTAGEEDGEDLFGGRGGGGRQLELCKGVFGGRTTMQMTNMATSEPVIAVRDDAIAGAIELEGENRGGLLR